MLERFFYDVYVNFGHLAVDNGAVAPIQKAFDIAACADANITNGYHYGDDKIECDKEVLSIVIELLEESKIPYRIHCHPEDRDPRETTLWRGLVTDQAKKVCRVTENYNPKYNKLFFQ